MVSADARARRAFRTANKAINESKYARGMRWEVKAAYTFTLS